MHVYSTLNRGALETLRLASARTVSGGKKREKALFRITTLFTRREHASVPYSCFASRSGPRPPSGSGPPPQRPCPRVLAPLPLCIHARRARVRDRGDSRGGSAAGAALSCFIVSPVTPAAPSCPMRDQTKDAYDPPVSAIKGHQFSMRAGLPRPRPWC